MKKVGIYFHPQWAAARTFADDLTAALESRVEKVGHAPAGGEAGGPGGAPACRRQSVKPPVEAPTSTAVRPSTLIAKAANAWASF